jgi:phosphoribosylanthranilate isomerase
MLSGVDLNSGFETEPGKKDLNKLGSFIRELRKELNTDEHNRTLINTD